MYTDIAIVTTRISPETLLMQSPKVSQVQTLQSSSISYTPASIPFKLCEERTTTLLGHSDRGGNSRQTNIDNNELNYFPLVIN